MLNDYLMLDDTIFKICVKIYRYMQAKLQECSYINDKNITRLSNNCLLFKFKNYRFIGRKYYDVDINKCEMNNIFDLYVNNKYIISFNVITHQVYTEKQYNLEIESYL